MLRLPCPRLVVVAAVVLAGYLPCAWQQVTDYCSERMHIPPRSYPEAHAMTLLCRRTRRLRCQHSRLLTM